MTHLQITPSTRIGELLDAYPQTEEVLISLSPVFVKLRNPVLRKTIARVTSLSQAALIGKIPVGVLVNKLRETIGQEYLSLENEDNEIQQMDPPPWFVSGRIAVQLDVRPMIETGHHPLELVFSKLRDLTSGEILEIISSFEPVPLIEKAKEKGYVVYVTEKTPGEHYIYFSRP